jgi:CRISPR-associated exonuclease Cas4
MTKETIPWETKIEQALNEMNDETSHRELDYFTFHPSQLSMCERQMYLSKLGIKSPNPKLLGIFRIGTMIHEFMENHVANDIEFLEFEKPLSTSYVHNLPEGHNVTIEVVGNCDCYDPNSDIVYDFKTRGSWYKFDPPNDKHLDQLTLYMDMLDIEEAQVIYINKTNFEVRTYPENGTFEKQQDRLNYSLRKAERVSMQIMKNGFAQSPKEIPFEKCDCFVCEQETDEVLTFDHLDNE